MREPGGYSSNKRVEDLAPPPRPRRSARMTLMLTDEERDRIVEAIYRGRVGSCRVTVENWGPAEDEEETHSLLLRVLRGESDRFVADAQATIESIVSARVRAARAQELRDAATAWNQGQWARHYAIPKQSEPAVERWLRDRANHIESSQTE